MVPKWKNNCYNSEALLKQAIQLYSLHSVIIHLAFIARKCIKLTIKLYVPNLLIKISPNIVQPHQTKILWTCWLYSLKGLTQVLHASPAIFAFSETPLILLLLLYVLQTNAFWKNNVPLHWVVGCFHFHSSLLVAQVGAIFLLLNCVLQCTIDGKGWLY